MHYTQIRMLIKNKISLEEVTTSVSHLLGDPQEQMATLAHDQRELYGALLYQLQQTPDHLARLTRCITNTRDIDNFLRYGDADSVVVFKNGVLTFLWNAGWSC